MENKTQSDVRRERFQNEARIARALGDKALELVDIALEEQERLETTLRASESNLTNDPAIVQHSLKFYQ